MSTANAISAGSCRVLELDSDLAEAIPEPRRAQAIRDCVVPELALEPGVWAPEQKTVGASGVGLMILQGLLIRRVGIDGRFGAELLGPGDLLRPWDTYGEPEILPRTTAWRVLDPARIAVLDERFTQQLGAYPELAARLVGRAVQRSRQLAVNMAIVHQPRVDMRLQMLLWHIAARWGRVTAQGVKVPLRLTHTLLAELAAARRPTVTTALSELARRKLVVTQSDGWLLCGQPPGELMELTPSPAPLLAERQRAAAC